MKKDIADYVTRCLTCQQVKAKHQVPSYLLQLINIPEWKWDRVTMNFISGLPLTHKRHDAVWMIVDRLTKSAHFLPVRTNYSLDKLAELYISEIVRLYEIPSYLTETRGSHPNFGKSFKKPWAHNSILVRLLILRWIDSLNE